MNKKPLTATQIQDVARGADLGTTVLSALPKGKRWGRVRDLPISTGLAYDLINAGAIESVVLRKRGGRKGIRLIDLDSFDRYLESLKGQQLTPWRPPGRKPKNPTPV